MWQVEGDYNKVLDKCAECRDGLGPICDNIALGTALEELWNRGAPCSTPDGVTGEGDEDGECRCCLQVPYIYFWSSCPSQPGAGVSIIEGAHRGKRLLHTSVSHDLDDAMLQDRADSHAWP